MDTWTRAQYQTKPEARRMGWVGRKSESYETIKTKAVLPVTEVTAVVESVVVCGSPFRWYQTGDVVVVPSYDEYRCGGCVGAGFAGPAAGSKPTAVVSPPSVKFTRVENPTASTCFIRSATDQDARLQQSTGVDSVDEILTSMPLSDATPPAAGPSTTCCCCCCCCCRFRMLFGLAPPSHPASPSLAVVFSLSFFSATCCGASSPNRYSGSPWLFSAGRLYLRKQIRNFFFKKKTSVCRYGHN